mgnify:CR=1 FL=1
MTDTSLIILLHGEALFRAGQPAKYFYLVIRGSIAIVDQAGLGKIREFGPNELFGIPEVLARGKWDLRHWHKGRHMCGHSMPTGFLARWQTCRERIATS